MLLWVAVTNQLPHRPGDHYRSAKVLRAAPADYKNIVTEPRHAPLLAPVDAFHQVRDDPSPPPVFEPVGIQHETAHQLADDFEVELGEIGCVERHHLQHGSLTGKQVATQVLGVGRELDNPIRLQRRGMAVAGGFFCDAAFLSFLIS